MQRRLPILAVVFLASTIVCPFAQIREQRPLPIRPVDGTGVFRTYCASCHGREGRGDGPVAKALRQQLPDLRRLAQRNSGKFPAVHVRNTIMFGADELLPAHGSKEMPIWGPIFHEIEFDQDLGNVRLENVSRYLESIQQK